eukprot:CAMPEP_0185623522 /NCGR_PEP_ID=MMETSP0436-20130131/59929_1 /TAXON_ID=626734 ORGANISM="Favella taraikaensis, Strain Fe Narragansett Bay" /NCGR_SAMPLE_ID=MMETSP0436 /ASSEMBLY_ACC=CAM_ASM_000390 /LENGTH=41 /DNA_ID= /DNA_START= /DNA_END= /DNA_ORIENTATION=
MTSRARGTTSGLFLVILTNAVRMSALPEVLQSGNFYLIILN